MKKGIALTALLFFVLTGLELEGFSSFFLSPRGEAGMQMDSAGLPSTTEEGSAEFLCEENEVQESRVRILPALLPVVHRTGYRFPVRSFVRREEDFALRETFTAFSHLLRAPPAV